MRKNTRRVLAFVMALALILGNFTGINMTAEAAGERAISDVSIAPGQVVSAKDGVVKATVQGTDLTTLYYLIQEYQYIADAGSYRWQTMDGQNNVEIASPSTTGGDISIPVPDNTGAEERRLRVAIYGVPNMSSNASKVEFKQEGTQGSSSTVDKSGLNAEIEKAGKLVATDYTEESWKKLQDALATAKDVVKDNNATEASVKEATTMLQQAIQDLQPADKKQPIIRIKVADESGKPVEGVTFTFKSTVEGNKEPEITPSDEKGETQFSYEGCAGIYWLKAVETDAYTFDPADGHKYMIAVSGELLSGSEDVVFTAEAKGSTEEPGISVTKDELRVKHDEVKAIYNNAKYTLNSRKPLNPAIAQARYVLETDDVTQQEINNAMKALEEVSKLPLKEVKGIGRLTVNLTAEEGTTLKDSIKFTLDNVKYNVPSNLFAYKGSFNWLLTGWEEKGEDNDYEIYLPEDSEYIATPAVLKIDLADEDGSAIIDKINGKTVTEGLAEIKLEAKSKDACDKVTFRAYAKDEDGNPVKGIKFDIKNSDLMNPVLVSDENGMIEYQVTKWDADSKITVSLQDGQGYSSTEKFEFSVIEDPEESTRAIISEINGEKVAGGEKPTFTLAKSIVEEGKLTKVSIAKGQTVPAKGGVVKATVEGTNLTTLYYQLQEGRMIDMGGSQVTTWEPVGTEGSIASPSATGGELSIPVSENKSAEERILRVGIHDKAGVHYLSSDLVQFTQEAGDGSAVEVDKSALNAAIMQADGLLEEDYTEESWSKLQAMLIEARRVAADGAATEEDVENATEKLLQAIEDLQSAANDQLTVRVKVADKEGKPIEGVKFTFKSVPGFNKEPEVEPSDKNGETTFSLEGCTGAYLLKATETDKYTFNPTDGHYITIGMVDGELEIIGNDGVINFLAKEKSDSGETEEARTINVKVADKEGNPIKGVEFTFVDSSTPPKETEVAPTNAKGESLIPIEKLNGRYNLKAKDTEEYTFAPEKGHEFVIVGGKFILEEDVVSKEVAFTATKAGEDPTPGANKEALKAKITEASKIDGSLYTEESYKKLTDALSEAQKVYDQTDATQEAVNTQVEKLTQAIADLQEKEQDLSNVHVKVVDEAGDPVSGVEFTFENGDGSHRLDIAPSNTKGETVFAVQGCNGRYTLKAVGNDDYTFSPETGYSITIFGGQLSKPVNATFTATEKSKPEIPEGDVQITKLTSDVQGDIPKSGATVNLSVEGKGLTTDNWSAEAVAYIQGTDMEATWMSKVKASNVTATGAQLVIPENSKVNALVWKVEAGVLKDGKLEKHQELVLQQAGKKSTEDVEIKQAILVDDKTLEVTFAKDIKIADEVASDETALNKMFTIKGKVTYDSEGKPNGTETYYLQKGDKVSASGTKLTIKFGEAIELNNGRFSFEEGALALADGSKNLLSYENTILSKPSVTSAKLEKDVFDYKGGKVVAKLQGVMLTALEESSIEASVTNPLTREELDLGLEIITGEEPQITFVVPENKTTTTQSYLLTIKVDGKQIYSGTGLRGDRIIASVLAEGVDAGAQTISAMTISGNNPYETGNSDQTKFNAYAVPGDEGSLKTEIRIAGTNFDSTKTELRAIDENGVIWPVSHVPE